MWYSIVRALKRLGYDKPIANIQQHGERVNVSFRDGSRVSLSVVVKGNMRTIGVLAEA